MINPDTLSICDRTFFDAGFARGSHFYFRKNGRVFQCVSLGRGRFDCYDDEVFLIIFPYWTAGLSRIDAWPSFEEAFTHQDLFKHGNINWPNYGVNISNDVYSYSNANRFSEFGEPKDIDAPVLIPYVSDKLIPLLDTVFDETSFKNFMVNLNRQCRVFEEIILQECFDADSIEPAQKWLDEMIKIDSDSTLLIAESLVNNTTGEDLERFGLSSFEDVYHDVKEAVKTTHDIFYGKLIKAVNSGDYKWIASLISSEQKKSNDFFKKAFSIKF